MKTTSAYDASLFFQLRPVAARKVSIGYFDQARDTTFGDWYRGGGRGDRGDPAA